MPLTATPPAWLNRLDCAKLTFVLKFAEAVELPPMAILQLRREFTGALKTLEEQQGREVVQPIKELMFPEPVADPVIQRQVQKPSAAVILSPDSSVCGSFVKDDQIALPAFFFGDGVICIDAFLLLLQALGERGIYRGQGRFVVSTLKLNHGMREEINIDAPSGNVAPAVVPLGWLLPHHSDLKQTVKLEVLSPMRLIKKGKPLFRLTFNDFFTALLRRIGSLVALHAGAEIDLEHRRLIELADNVECPVYDLQWRDWRRLEHGRSSQGIGGLTGTMTLAGTPLSELFWLLEVGSLLHVGKGATYGCGRYRLLDVVDQPENFS